MSDFLDDLWFGIKKVTAVAGQKTGELAEMGKLKYQEQGLKRDLAKTYAKLGGLVYESRVDGADLEDSISNTVDEITTLNAELDNIDIDMETAKEEFKKAVDIERPIKEEVDIDIDLDLDKEDIVFDEETQNKAEDLASEVDNLADEILDNLHKDETDL